MGPKAKYNYQGPYFALDSVFGNSIREKAVRSQQKHSWKASGSDGSPFGSMLWGKPATTGDIPIAITSICSGRNPGALLYSLQRGSLCALLEVGELGSEERRVWGRRAILMQPIHAESVFGYHHRGNKWRVKAD